MTAILNAVIFCCVSGRGYSGNKLVVKVTHIFPLDGLVVGGGNWVMMSVSHIEDNDIQPFMDAVLGGVQ